MLLVILEKKVSTYFYLFPGCASPNLPGYFLWRLGRGGSRACKPAVSKKQGNAGVHQQCAKGTCQRAVQPREWQTASPTLESCLLDRNFFVFFGLLGSLLKNSCGMMFGSLVESLSGSTARCASNGRDHPAVAGRDECTLRAAGADCRSFTKQDTVSKNEASQGWTLSLVAGSHQVTVY